MKKLIALSCLAAVLLAGCGNNGSGKKSEKEKETTTAAVTTTAQQTTEEVTAEAETTTEPDSKPQTGDRTTMYHGVYMDKIKEKYNELAEWEDGKVRMAYTLYDADADGVPDLVLNYDFSNAGEPVEGTLEIYTCDENCELAELGYIGPTPAAWGCSADEGSFSLIYEMEDYIGIHNWVMIDGSAKISDSVEFDRDENTVTKEVMADNGFRYLPYVNIVGSGDVIKSAIIDPNTDSSEEKDGLYLDYLG